MLKYNIHYFIKLDWDLWAPGASSITYIQMDLSLFKYWNKCECSKQIAAYFWHRSIFQPYIGYGWLFERVIKKDVFLPKTERGRSSISLLTVLLTKLWKKKRCFDVNALAFQDSLQWKSWSYFFTSLPRVDNRLFRRLYLPVHLHSSSYRVVFKLFRYLLSHILETLSNKFLLLFIYAIIIFFFIFCFVSGFLDIFALHSSKIFKPILLLLYKFLFPRTVWCSSCNLTPCILFQATFVILY
jgi:hypothetical protein